MSDMDPEVVRLIRKLLILTDTLGVGHRTRAQSIAHQLDLAGKVLIDKGSVPNWMEQAPDALTSERKYRFKDES
jgi:predicted glycosyltransferase